MKISKPRFTLITLALCAVPSHLGPAALAAEEEDMAHEALRILRRDVIESINRGDLEGVLVHAHPNIVITWQNNEVCRGHEGMREFHERMGKKAFGSYKVVPEPDEVTALYGDDTGISFGGSVGNYTLMGKEFEFHNRWTATLVRENNAWLIAAYHVSLNALDNAILNTAKKSLFAAGMAGAVIGLILGFLVFRRKSVSTT